MEQIRGYKYYNYRRFALLSIITLIMFIFGFITGSSVMYSFTSSEIDELQYQIDNINPGSDSNIIEVQNNTYYYNDTSLSDVYKQVEDSIVVISGIVSYQTFFHTRYYEVQGSGFIMQYDNDVVVITNNHVVSDVSEIIITFSNGNSYSGELIGSDIYSDLAVLSINAPADELYPLDVISSSHLEVGDPVIAIGSPMGLDSTMTVGIVSQTGRTIEESEYGNYLIANIIQTSVAINPGNSGGPLLDYQGNVVGITTAIIEDSEGLGFAIPSNTILREIESLIETGVYDQHPWIGISGTDMTYSIAQAIGTDVTYGWLIAAVSSGSAADEAGLIGGNQQLFINDEFVIIGGDIIIAIDGNRIINSDALLSYIEENTQPSQTVIFTVIRENQQLDISVELDARPVI